ncbi:hypothetical protein ACHAQJ_005489 [Trichoderma viride]
MSSTLRTFPLLALPQYDHYNEDNIIFGAMFWHEPTKLIVEIRQNSRQAEAQGGWDPIT